MKKNLIALMAAIAMFASCGTVLADEEINLDAKVDTGIQGDIMLISNNSGELVIPISMPSYVSKTITVTEVTEEKISTTINEDDAENPENTINYTLTDDTLILGYAKGDVKSLEDVKVGDKITVYSNGYNPALLILPPQYQADVIFVEDNSESDSSSLVDVDTYVLKDETLVNAANTLALNIDENTEIVDVKGNKVEEDKIANNDLVVVYMDSTKSIPAQTTPIKIVVLGENEAALANINAAQNNETSSPEETPVPDVTSMSEETPAPVVDYSAVTEVKVGDKTITNVYAKGNTLMVPLREIAEAVDFTIDWDGDLKAVMINGGIYSLKIGENSYVKGRMAPIELKSAPEITNDLTYVPVEYFSEVIEGEITAGTANTISVKVHEIVK